MAFPHTWRKLDMIPLRFFVSSVVFSRCWVAPSLLGRTGRGTFFRKKTNTSPRFVFILERKQWKARRTDLRPSKYTPLLRVLRRHFFPGWRQPGGDQHSSLHFQIRRVLRARLPRSFTKRACSRRASPRLASRSYFRTPCTFGRRDSAGCRELLSHCERQRQRRTDAAVGAVDRREHFRPRRWKTRTP